MSATRALLLAASQNRWLREHASRYAFVKKSVSRFMPGETLADAIGAARALKAKKIQTLLTHLGLDLSPELCEQNLRRLFAAENPARTLWIDMEASGYVDATLSIYRKLLAEHANAGICLQAYLHRTESDIESLLPMKPSIRLVKGAYSERPEIALGKKGAIDANYF